MIAQSLRGTSAALLGTGEPDHVAEDGLSRTWIVRGGNFAVCYTQARSGAVLARSNDEEEYMVILPHDGSALGFEAGSEAFAANADSLTIVPPGASCLTALSDGAIVRIFSKVAGDVMALAGNADVYADGAPELARPELWPSPVDGFRLRHYRMADYGGAVETTTPRVFRSTNMMVNIFAPVRRRRRTDALSPHWHEDFEQGSLALAGTWVHHVRFNWGADLSTWRKDDHLEIGSPSIVIIPARAIHTSQDIGADGPEARLVDIFCPPRMDFSSRPGFVLNEGDYPLPTGKSDASAKTAGTLMSWQASP